MKRYIIAAIAVLLTFIATTIVVSVIILRGDQILTNFSIISVENVSTTFEIRHQRVRAATHYDIVVYNINNTQVFAKTVEETTNTINLPMLQYDMEYIIMIYAFDVLGNQRGVNNPFNFRYTEPTFSNENSLLLIDEEDYVLSIYGNLTKKDYYLKISANNSVLLETRLTENEFVIEHSLFTETNQSFNIQIFDGDISIHQITLFNNISPISDLTITAPIAGTTLDFNDITLMFEGGENATEYSIRIYDGRRLVRETTIRRNRVVLSHEIFEMAREYRLVLTASYRDYDQHTKRAEVIFSMNDRRTLMPVYMNVHHRYVRAGTEIELNHPNATGNIFFTLDGTDPTVYGIRYEEPFVITENVHLRTVVMEPLFNNSVIGEFPINVGTKRQYTVYLSPSNQSRNFGVQSTGFTNEMREANVIADYMEARLRANGVRVLRNNPRANINTWTSESRFHGADLHFAIHSNASPSGRAHGVETWINEQTSRTFSLASHIQNSLMGIYWSDDPIANRGVRFANGALGEVNELMVPFGILVEVAFHDHEQDAAWIVQNHEMIANAMSDAILRYFGII